MKKNLEDIRSKKFNMRFTPNEYEQLMLASNNKPSKFIRQKLFGESQFKKQSNSSDVDTKLFGIETKLENLTNSINLLINNFDGEILSQNNKELKEIVEIEELSKQKENILPSSLSEEEKAYQLRVDAICRRAASFYFFDHTPIEIYVEDLKKYSPGCKNINVKEIVTIIKTRIKRMDRLKSKERYAYAKMVFNFSKEEVDEIYKSRQTN